MRARAERGAEGGKDKRAEGRKDKRAEGNKRKGRKLSQGTQNEHKKQQQRTETIKNITSAYYPFLRPFFFLKTRAMENGVDDVCVSVCFSFVFNRRNCLCVGLCYCCCRCYRCYHCRCYYCLSVCVRLLFSPVAATVIAVLTSMCSGMGTSRAARHSRKVDFPEPLAPIRP